MREKVSAEYGIDDERCATFTLLRTGRAQAADGRRAVAVVTTERALSVFWRLGNDPEIAECTQLLNELRDVTVAPELVPER